MKIMHISDTHGKFLSLNGDFDIIVHSGDFFPNSVNWYDPIKEADFQFNWLRQNLINFSQWTQDKPIIFVPGNHDFLDPNAMENLLNRAGIQFFHATNKLIHHSGINFYGFPYINYIYGYWNYESTPQTVAPHINKLVNVLNSTYVDVLISHSPLYQHLDFSNSKEFIGNVSLTNALDYRIEKDMMPKYLLCGHCHEAAGTCLRGDMFISNAATQQRIISL